MKSQLHLATAICLLVTAVSGCQTMSNGVAAMSNGMKALGGGLASVTGQHPIFKHKGGKQANQPLIAKSKGFPADHYSNSPEFKSLSTRTPSDNMFVRSWQNTKSAIGGVLKPKPKVVQADDPISLATKVEPLDAGFFINAAEGMASRGDFQGAESQYVRVLKKEPTNLAALVGLARVLDQQGNHTKAEEIYGLATEAHPKNASLANEMGLFRARHGRMGEAVAAVDRATRLAPDNARYRNNLATLLVNAGQPDAALEQLKMVHLPAGAHYNLGYLLHRQGANAQACHHFEMAMQHDPSLAHARQMLARLTPTTTIANAPPANTATQTDSAQPPAQPVAVVPESDVAAKPTEAEIVSQPPSRPAVVQVSTGALGTPVPILPSVESQEKATEVATRPTPAESPTLTDPDAPLPPIVKIR